MSNTRNPVDKSYRKMVRGMERFAREQPRLAPGASLRFRLLPRLPSVQLDDVTLHIVGDTLSLPVTLASDHSFTLERNDAALREDAALIANRKTSSLTWRADVRSPGVPEGMRRLGDLRLECLVGMEAGLVSNNARLFAWLSDWLASSERVCTAADGNYLFFSERPLFSVTLQAGERRAVLSFRQQYAGGTQDASTLPYCDCQVLLDRSYYAPLWDASWPDDTLLSFEYMDDPAPPAATAVLGAQPGATRAQLRASLGAATEIGFDSGMAVWLYPPLASKQARTAQPQALLLFGADGRLLKSRQLPAAASSAQ
ncbi:hypothetical protein MJ904_10295 [Massilia sp. MB5]|uniref:hypothetical protein n=1 Tax=Massilia sp. MB5 TaxID=2919578 RepID=UPI001F114017|nr:hypothetical protein [Massilia sp. MB5]UMR32529.1 hypothetical protein MJ904_10295 [Massilia sp. MB5]